MTAIEDAAEDLNRLWPRNLSLAFANAIRKYMNAAEAEIQRLTAPPTDHEREALAQDIRIVDGSHSLGAAALADSLVERGWGRRQGPITDEYVTKLAHGAYMAGAGAFANMFVIERWIRAALEAARDAS